MVDWEELWENLVSKALPSVTSDHCPIPLGQEALFGGPSPFRFKNMWLKDPSFKLRVKDWWEEGRPRNRKKGVRFMRTLKALKGKTKDWNKDHFGRIEEGQERISSRIEELDIKEAQRNFSEEEREERWKLKVELEEILRNEEISWRQKSRCKWLQGDKNTRFFHSLASGKRSKNLITTVVVDGIEVRREEEIVKVFLDHFKGIFSRMEGNRQDLPELEWIG
ncbi:PREDICTED: uncharacterized protein LOC104596672 [Nelumbo nucifera]|uniref:Uncharacterized protein LOC104596672 n=1 Tax=Nelumbo nucifera TaxID=4432 RepID=A0A1U7ZPY1_NELNU|nr:PREDICTED: uncharacterized protein LOC104596672 [Nelumbo nucifera]